MMRGRAHIDTTMGKYAAARVWKELEKHGFKERTLEWLANMSRNDRINLLCLTDFPWLVNTLTKMYLRHQQNKKLNYAFREVLGSRTLSPEDINRPLEPQFLVKTDIKHENRSLKIVAAEQKLMEGMVLCSRVYPYDSISVGPSLIDHIDTLIELLNDATDKKFLVFNMSSIGAVNSNEFFFSSWFNQSSLNSIGSWVAALIERQIAIGMINHLNEQDKSVLSNQNNPLRKQKLIRKVWNKLPDELQEQRIAQVAKEFKETLNREKNSYTQKTLRFLEQMVLSISKMNELQAEKSSEYAVLLKRRKEPSLFIDSVLFPTFEQFESISRLHLWYLGQELLQSVGTPELSPSPSPAPAKEEEKKKKKVNKTAKKKKKMELEKKNTAGEITQAAGVFGSAQDSSSMNKFEVLTSPQFGQQPVRRTEDVAPRGPRTMRVDSESDEGSWIPADRRLRGHILSKKEGKNLEPKEKKTHSVRKHEKRAKSKQSILSAGVSNNNKNNLAKRVRQQMEELGSGVSKAVSGGAIHFGSSGGSRGGDILREVKTVGRVSTAAEKNESKTVMTEDLKEEQDSTTSLETESIACSLDGNNSLKPPSGHFVQATNHQPFLRLSHIQSTEKPNSKLGPGNGSSRFSYDSLNMRSPTKSSQGAMDEKSPKQDWITAELDEILYEIRDHSNAVKPLRTVAENRIKRVLAASFGNSINQLSLETYGSSATQLVIQGSDIDICIRGFGNIDRASICSVLQTLGTNISLFKWCTELKMILTATVPVIKLEFQVGTNIEAEFKKVIAGDDSQELEIPKKFDAWRGLDYSSRVVSVDVTLDCINALGMSDNAGIRTTEFIKTCLEVYPSMRDLVLLFKWILAARGLNKAYTGGLSSYSVSLLVLAFIQSQGSKLKRSITRGDIFKKFLEFYGKKFNPRTHAVIPSRPQPYAPAQHPLQELGSPIDAPLFLLDPTNIVMAVNITQGANLTSQILGLLGTVLDQIESRHTSNNHQDGQKFLKSIIQPTFN